MVLKQISQPHFINIYNLKNTIQFQCKNHISKTLEHKYVQHMGNLVTNIFWSPTHTNPNCTLCQSNERDTWPHLLSNYTIQYIKGPRIVGHNKAVHHMAQTLQANKFPGFVH